MHPIFEQFGNFSFCLLISIFAWRYYRNKSYPVCRRYSTFSPRFWAVMVDVCVMWPIGFVAYLLVALEPNKSILIGVIILENLLALLYIVIMHKKYGQTYGKMICKVRVVDFATEGALSFRQAFLREAIPIAANGGILGYEIYMISTGSLSQEAVAKGEIANDQVFWILGLIPFLWFVAEIATMLTNEKRRALHDYLAGTVVIRTNVIG